MKIDLSTPTPTIDAADLARALDLTPEQVKTFMRSAEITSRFETGTDEDAGTHRMTFWHEQIRVQFTCDAEGNVTKTSRIRMPTQP